MSASPRGPFSCLYLPSTGNVGMHCLPVISCGLCRSDSTSPAYAAITSPIEPSPHFCLYKILTDRHGRGLPFSPKYVWMYIKISFCRRQNAHVIRKLNLPQEYMQKPDDVMDIAHITGIKGLGFRFVLGFELAPNRNLPIEIKKKYREMILSWTPTEFENHHLFKRIGIYVLERIKRTQVILNAYLRFIQ